MVADHPIRIKSGKSQAPNDSKFFRGCMTCNASFIGLAPGKTGERGIWQRYAWYCSIECTPKTVLDELNLDEDSN